jgi:hypothetical protein
MTSQVPHDWPTAILSKPHWQNYNRRRTSLILGGIKFISPRSVSTTIAAVADESALHLSLE